MDCLLCCVIHLKLTKMNVISRYILRQSFTKSYTTASKEPPTSNQFETVFSFPAIKYFAIINRLKVFQIAGTSLVVPGCGLLEMFSVVPENTFLTASYIGLTGTAVLSLCTLPFRNIIGYLYIRNDDKKIKISSVDFWGRRQDRIVDVENWIPLLEMKPKALDALYLTPQLTDGTKYKLLVKFGKVLNASKIGQVLE